MRHHFLWLFGLILSLQVSGAAIRLTDDPEDSLTPSVAVDSDQNLHLTWKGAQQLSAVNSRRR